MDMLPPNFANDTAGAGPFVGGLPSVEENSSLLGSPHGIHETSGLRNLILAKQRVGPQFGQGSLRICGFLDYCRLLDIGDSAASSFFWPCENCTSHCIIASISIDLQAFPCETAVLL